MISVTGTGTQSDPYIVDNVDDFIETVGMVDVYIKLKNDINFNVGNYYNTDSSINIRCKELDGGGVQT